MQYIPINYFHWDNTNGRDYVVNGTNTGGKGKVTLCPNWLKNTNIKFKIGHIERDILCMYPNVCPFEKTHVYFENIIKIHSMNFGQFYCTFYKVAANFSGPNL